MRARTLVLLLGVGVLLVADPAAHAKDAITIDAFAPATVAGGDRVTIRGDFEGLRGRRPRVFAERDGVRRRLRLRVVDHDAESIVAVVRKVPNPARSPSNGAEWTLRVASTGRRHRASAVADGPLVTSAPVIEDVRPDAVHAGWDMLLLVRCPGRRRPRVLFGDAAVPSRRVQVDRNIDGTPRAHVWARVPRRVGNGEHQVVLKAVLGEVKAARRPKVAGCDEPPPPPPNLGNTVQMNVTVTGEGFEKKLKKGFVFREFLFDNTVLIQGCFNEGVDERCAQFGFLNIGYQTDSRFVGSVFTETIRYTDSSDFGNGNGSGVNDLSWESVGDKQCEIIESSSTRIKGVFRGTVIADREDIQPQQLKVEGDFVIKR